MGTYPEMSRLVERHGPEAVVAALRPLLTDERAARIESTLDARLGSVSVALENLHDAHNGAAAIRSIEAFGLTTLHVVETEKRFDFSSKVTIGCEKWVAVRRHTDVAGCAAALRERGMTLWATLPGADATLETVPVDRPLALWFGNEHAGLTEEAVAACDGAVSIPMVGFTQSFNLSVSVALAIERVAARRRAHLGVSGDLGGQERAFLRARWYALSVRGAAEIVAKAVSK